MIPAKLLAVLQCPSCGGELRPDMKGDNITCTRCQAMYQIKNDILIMVNSDDGRNGSR